MPKPEGEGAETNVGICATGWTELRQSSRMNGPIYSVQTLNSLEVAVSGNKEHPVTFPAAAIRCRSREGAAPSSSGTVLVSRIPMQHQHRLRQWPCRMRIAP